MHMNYTLYVLFILKQQFYLLYRPVKSKLKNYDMAVKVFLLLISISCFLTSSIGLLANSNNNNRRNGINRNCKLLSDCPEFLWLLRNKYDVPGMGFQEVLQYLQSQQCGFDGNDPKVKIFHRPNTID